MFRRNARTLKSLYGRRINIDLDFQLKLMHIAGIRQDRPALHCSRIYVFYTLLVFIISLTHLLTMIVILPQYVSDVSKAGIVMSMILSYIEVIFKIADVFLYRHKIDRLITTMLKEFSRVDIIDDEMQETTVRDSLKLTRKVCIVFLFLTVSACTMWCLEPVVYKVMHIIYIREKNLYETTLPFAAWYPFDTSMTPAYEITYLYQVMAGYLGTIITCATDLLFVSLMIFTATHLEMLGNSLKMIRLKKHSKFNKFEENSEGQYPLWILEAKKRYDKEQDEQTYFQLLQCIEHHNSIIKFAQELEEVISPVMFFQFIATALEVCFAGFQAKLVSDWGPNFFKCIMYTLANILQTFCYCRFGESIIVESNKFAFETYNSEWYEGSKVFKSTVKMILMRSQKPLTLVAGKFYTLSLQSFAQLLNMSYSFLTVLQQLHE